MELPEIRQLGFQEMIPNKKNKMTQMEALYIWKSPVKLGREVKQDELIDYKEFDKIRNHARRGIVSEWTCSIRRIYDIDTLWKCEEDGAQQIICENDFFMMDKGGEGDTKYVILYYIVVLWGMEFAINMAEPEINEYNKWVNQHGGLSPLYVKKNFEKYKLDFAHSFQIILLNIIVLGEAFIWME